jgi:hypothetical protein
MAKRKSILNGCSCSQCRRGLHSVFGHIKVGQLKRSLRRITKELLKKEKYDEAMEVILTTGYLD